MRIGCVEQEREREGGREESFKFQSFFFDYFLFKGKLKIIF